MVLLKEFITVYCTEAAIEGLICSTLLAWDNLIYVRCIGVWCCIVTCLLLIAEAETCPWKSAVLRLCKPDSRISYKFSQEYAKRTGDIIIWPHSWTRVSQEAGYCLGWVVWDSQQWGESK